MAIVFDWIEQQVRRQEEEAGYQSAVAELEQALDRQESRPELEKLYYKVQSCQRGIPEVLGQRYRLTLRRLRFATFFRRLFRSVLFIATLILIGLGTTWWLDYQSREQRLRTALQTLEQLQASAQLAEARAYLRELEQTDPEIAARGQIHEWQIKLRTGQKEAEERKVRFQEALKDAQQAPLTPTGDELVHKASSLAQDADEVAAVDRLRRERSAKKKELLEPLSPEEALGQLKRDAPKIKVERRFSKRDFEYTMTDGAVSRITTEEGGARRWIQHTANINAGNSGGPLLHENGTVIAMNTLSFVKAYPGVSGVFFSLSMDQFKTEIEKHVRNLVWE